MTSLQSSRLAMAWILWQSPVSRPANWAKASCVYALAGKNIIPVAPACDGNLSPRYRIKCAQESKGVQKQARGRAVLSSLWPVALLHILRTHIGSLLPKADKARSA